VTIPDDPSLVPSRSRIHGCLLAGAIGDALGAPVEFSTSARILADHGADGVRRFLPSYGLGGGAITDDTQMTLFTAEGLIRSHHRGAEKGIVHPPTMVWHAYQRWLSTQRSRPGDAATPVDGWLLDQPFLHHQRAPGGTCLSALRRGVAGTVEAPPNTSKGCGAIMRVAPVGIVLPPREAFTLGVDTGVLTHGHPSGYLPAGVLAMLVSSVLRGQDLAQAAGATLAVLSRWSGHEETSAYIELALDRAAAGDRPTPTKLDAMAPPSKDTAGWMGHDALGVSLWCALAAADLLDGLSLAASHGGDSDSTSAITGNLLGAAQGEEALPELLLRDLEGAEVITQVADDLSAITRSITDRLIPDHDRYPPW